MSLRFIYESLIFGGIAVVIVSAAPLALVAFLYCPNLLIFLAALAGTVCLAIVGSEIVLYRMERSLRSFEQVARRIAAGELSARAYPTWISQMFPLYRAMNVMAGALERRVEALVRLSSEQDAILRAMVEGVVAIDAAGRVRRVNEAAIELLEINASAIEGRLVPEVIHHAALHRFISNASESDSIYTATVALPGIQEKILDLIASPLIEKGRATRGTLLVIHDVTRVRALENVRRQFVANVSHELKTPITSIKGFVETLLEGAMDDPAHLRKFLKIIERQSERLHSIFNDLLMLAKLEAWEGEEGLETDKHNVRELVQLAIDECAQRSLERKKDLLVEVPSDLVVFANSTLVQQALVNLLDNAIKYSEAGTPVRVEAHRDGDLTEIRVVDCGPGIDHEHLPRLFERFYRIDTGRSRQVGGTGLGLAIVKHIAQAHGGKVNVSSVLGKGSEFSLYLRAAL